MVDLVGGGPEGVAGERDLGRVDAHLPGVAEGPGLASLGGENLMPGFRAGRLYDRSALVGTLRYSWPIWIWLDGAMHFELGNVFGEHLAGFALEKLRWSGTLGIQSSGTSENPLQIMVGVGSEPFEAGAEIDSFRFLDHKFPVRGAHDFGGTNAVLVFKRFK